MRDIAIFRCRIQKVITSRDVRTRELIAFVVVGTVVEGGRGAVVAGPTRASQDVERSSMEGPGDVVAFQVDGVLGTLDRRVCIAAGHKRRGNHGPKQPAGWFLHYSS